MHCTKRGPKKHLQKLLFHWLQVLKLAHLCFWYSCLTFLNSFSSLPYPPSFFFTLRSVQATIYGMHVVILGPPEFTVFPPMLFSIISCASFLLNCKVGINFPPFWKCPSASYVFTSVTAKYHAKFLSGQNLVTHVLLIEIVACLLFFFRIPGGGIGNANQMANNTWISWQGTHHTAPCITT